ncbi:tetratricopeptide repeat (TPR)-like superfamily protein [Actinidia rufa]|uniref:Tetratricopeptide repeat (TPR)-like superfamily protein n=1 Tax=Actinidia rufa TaxID=165716 RepID=A0A7J0G7D2_9ERIC|nr:tetratricopeptide repeat (TPR)-like superfamily protein [Actinidia rufa]
MFPLHLHPLTSSSPQIHNNPNLCVEPKKSNNPELHRPSLAEGIFSDAISSVRTCITTRDLKLGSCVHAKIVKSGLHSDEFISNSLIDMYSKCDHIEQAAKVFDKMPHRTVVLLETLPPNEYTLAVLLRACAKKCDPKLVEAIHCFAMKYGFDRDDFLQNSLIDAYTKSGKLKAAEEVLDRFSGRDVVSLDFSYFWSCGFCFNGEGLYLSPETMASLLQGCADSGSFVLGEATHGMMSAKDIITWNTLMTCLVKNERSSEVLKLLSEIHAYGAEDDISQILSRCSHQFKLVQTWQPFGLVNLDFAEQIFEDMPVRDLGSWNSLIAAYGINGSGTSALQIFTKLQESGIYQPNAITFVNILSACGRAGLIEAASGRLDESRAFIENMSVRPGPDVWGALLGASALFNNVEMAEKAARKLAVLEPNSNVWRVAMSNVYASVGRWEDAAKARAEIRKSEELKKEEGWSSVDVRGNLHRFTVADTTYPESETIYEVLNGMQEQMREIAITDSRVA